MVYYTDIGLGPAEEYLDEEEASVRSAAGGGADRTVMPELSCLLDSFPMFGHMVDNSLFLQLCKSIETVPVPAGQYLFRVGDPDDCIYVVQTGKVMNTVYKYY